MDHRADVAGGELSYGQSKLVELARALSLETPMLLLDEPMSGINPTLRQELLQRIRGLRSEHGRTFLIIEHDIEMIMAICDRIIVLDHGRLIAHGTPEEIRSDEAVVRAYLGTSRHRHPAEGPDDIGPGVGAQDGAGDDGEDVA